MATLHLTRGTHASPHHRYRRTVEPHRARRAGGFSIPELLAVVAIILIILAMIMPTFSGGKEAVYASYCSNNLRQIMVATNNYATDNKIFLPFPNWGGWGIDLKPHDRDEPRWFDGGWLYFNKTHAKWDSDADWVPEILDTGLIFPYHNSRDVYRCPQDYPPYPILSGQVTSYNMNGSVCGYGDARTFKRSQFSGSDFLIRRTDSPLGPFWLVPERFGAGRPPAFVQVHNALRASRRAVRSPRGSRPAEHT